MQDVPAPASGGFIGAVHVFPVRVYFEDTDAGGIVYYANYLKFAERARTEMMRLLGFSHTAFIGAEGWAFTVRDCDVAYLAAAMLDDVIEIHTRIRAVGGATIALEQTASRSGLALARLRLRLAGRRADGRPARLPPQLREKLATLMTAADATSENAGPGR